MNTLKMAYRNQTAYVQLNRPERKNAMSFEMMRELVAAAKMLKKNREIRAVILCGAAGTFCSGIDLADLRNPKNRTFAAWELLKPGKSLFQRAPLVWRELPVPVIAVVEGYCFGAGAQLMLAADFAFATPAAQIALMESRWGIVPDMGVSVSARGRIRADDLKQLMYTAEPVGGEEAAAIGLISDVADDPMRLAENLADAVAARSPDAVLAAKRIVDGMDGRAGRALRREKIWQFKLLTGKNQSRAVRRDKDGSTAFLPRQYD